MRTSIFFKLLTVVCLLSFSAFSQGKSQSQLEKERKNLEKEIVKINSILFSNKEKEKSAISKVEDLNYRVKVRKELVRIINSQANLINRKITENLTEITVLKKDIEELKQSYAELIQQSYKTKSSQSRLMFLLSADNFKQAYKRFQYLQQYNEYQKDQAKIIRQKTTDLEVIVAQLKEKQKEKKLLLAKNKEEKLLLEQELAEQQILVNKIKSDIGKYASSIKDKQKEIDVLDKAIDKLIKEAIAKANKSKKSNAEFKLTPEAKALAKRFESNKGKLPWPVSKGIVKLKFGTQPSPIDPSLKISSNGIRIATAPNSEVKSVFKGEVLAVHIVKRGNPSVLIRHGNYITVYKNLEKLFVKRGDKVETNQSIGTVFTNSKTGETLLSFSVFQNTKAQNPLYWLMKL